MSDPSKCGLNFKNKFNGAPRFSGMKIFLGQTAPSKKKTKFEVSFFTKEQKKKKFTGT